MKYDCSRAPSTWGEHIRQHRLCEEKTIAEVAKAVGISSNELGRIERDEAIPRLDAAVWLAIYYGVTLDELIGQARPAEGR